MGKWWKKRKKKVKHIRVKDVNLHHLYRTSHYIFVIDLNKTGYTGPTALLEKMHTNPNLFFQNNFICLSLAALETCHAKPCWACAYFTE